jgi:hypothetical protein
MIQSVKCMLCDPIWLEMLPKGGLTDAEEEEGEQCDWVAGEFPGKRPGRWSCLGGLHVVLWVS